jgi:hypothetical protein
MKRGKKWKEIQESLVIEMTKPGFVFGAAHFLLQSVEGPIFFHEEAEDKKINNRNY